MMHMTPTSAYITKEDINLLACNSEITWSAYVDIPNPHSNILKKQQGLIEWTRVLLTTVMNGPNGYVIAKNYMVHQDVLST